jgi:hypothetical protein
LENSWIVDIGVVVSEGQKHRSCWEVLGEQLLNLTVEVSDLSFLIFWNRSFAWDSVSNQVSV